MISDCCGAELYRPSKVPTTKLPDLRCSNCEKVYTPPKQAMKDTTTTIDEILDNFIAGYKETISGRDQRTHDEAKQALLQWHQDKARSYVELLKSDLQKFEELWQVWGVEYGIDFNMEAIEQTLKAIEESE